MVVTLLLLWQTLPKRSQKRFCSNVNPSYRRQTLRRSLPVKVFAAGPEDKPDNAIEYLPSICSVVVRTIAWFNVVDAPVTLSLWATADRQHVRRVGMAMMLMAVMAEVVVLPAWPLMPP